MKKMKLVLFFILLLLPIMINADENNVVKLYLFHSSTCPHCEQERNFLSSIEDNYDNLEIIKYEVNSNEMNYNFMNKVVEAIGINATGVPLTIIGTDYYVGYTDETGESIKESIEKFINNSDNNIDVVTMIKNKEDISNIEFNKDNSIRIPIIGKIDAKSVSLPLISIFLGLLDGFNPCAMWVLLFLISMLFNMKDKKKMWILGIVFLTTSALVYLLFMLAWLKVALSFSEQTFLRVLISLVALIGGIINLRSYIKNKKSENGCDVVDDKKRKKIFNEIKKITSEKRFILAIIGIMALAISVNLIEVACSAGLPLIFTQLLAINNLNTFEYSLYMFLYILFFLLDDIIIFVLSMVTLSVKGISSKYGKYSHLIGGIIMIIISLLMVFKPEWLSFNLK